MAARRTLEELAALSRLWDEAQQIPSGGRERWLSGLTGRDASLRTTLRRMLLDEHGTDGFLRELPPLGDDEADTQPGQDGHAEGEDVGPYRLMRLLGSGGMGSVWLAERNDGLIKRPIALKLLHRWMITPHFLERFAREREILASLTHPFIARLYDAGLCGDGQPYLALEYVAGSPLNVHCDVQRMSLRDRLGMFLQVLEAVRFAHAHHVIHRDIKPSNILVSPDGHVHLLDFGIAKLITDSGGDATLTQHQAAALTPSYASPEQIAGESVTTASDVYSLGVLLYELLCGQRPYRLADVSRGALARVVLDADVVLPSRALTPSQARACSTTPRKLASALRGDLDTITLKALKKSPTQRYDSVESLAADIERHLDNAPVLARPDSAWYRYGRHLRRHRLECGAIAGVILSLSAGMVAAIWKADEAREQARVAQAAVSFMEDVFHADQGRGGEGGRGAAMASRDLLDIGARRIESGLKDAPAAQLRLLKSLGEMYAQRSLYKEAADMAGKRLQLARTLHDSSHPEVIDALLALAEAQASLDTVRGAPALATLHELNSALDQANDRESRRRGNAERLFAAALAASPDSDFAQAMVHMDAAIRIFRAGPEPAALAGALYAKAVMLIDARQYEQARDLLEQGLQGGAPIAGTPLRNDLEAQLCWVQRALGRRALAKPHCQQSPGFSASTAAAEDALVLRRTDNTAFVLEGISRLDEAVTLMEDRMRLSVTLAQQGKVADAAKYWASYGARLIAYGRVEQGLSVLELPNKAGQWEKLDALDRASLLEQKAAAFIEFGRYEQALEALDTASDLRRYAGAISTATNNANLAIRTRLLLAQGRGEAAAEAVGQMRLPPEASNPLNVDRVERDVLLAESELARNDFAAAALSAQQIQGRIDQSESPSDFDLFTQRLERLRGIAQWRRGNPAAARAHLERASRLSVALFDPHSLVTAQAQSSLAAVYRDLGMRSAAAALLSKARTIRAAHKEMGAHYADAIDALDAMPRASAALVRDAAR